MQNGEHRSLDLSTADSLTLKDEVSRILKHHNLENPVTSIRGYVFVTLPLPKYVEAEIKALPLILGETLATQKEA